MFFLNQFLASLPQSFLLKQKKLGKRIEVIWALIYALSYSLVFMTLCLPMRLEVYACIIAIACLCMCMSSGLCFHALLESHYDVYMESAFMLL